MVDMDSEARALKPLRTFVFRFITPRGKCCIEARMLPGDNESESALLARARKQVMESHPEAKGWRMTGVEKLDGN